MENRTSKMSENISFVFGKGLLHRENQTIYLDMNELKEESIEIYEAFLGDPLTFISLCRDYVKTMFNVSEKNFKIRSFEEKADISNIREADLGKVFKFKGIISKITRIMLEVISKDFECQTCGTIIRTQGKPPTRCSCGYYGKRFLETRTIFRDLQEMEIEEMQDDIEGRQPQKIRVRLTSGLTDKNYNSILQPGNKVAVTGVVEKIKLVTKLEDEELFGYRIFAIDVENAEESFNDNISDEDMEQINAIASRNPIDLLSKSLAPNIFGNDDLKKILLLQMVGGVKKTLIDGKTTRDRIHLLVVGDPATSKTELAKNIYLRCPKCYYSSGDNATSAGLTATVEKDELTGSWGVKIGPICKANGSLSIIDEIDKCKRDYLLSLHTPMESGIVALSKAGIDTKIPAESSILALANPKQGIFESGKPIVEQINLPAPLLSRFDIIYVMRDKIDKYTDDKIVDIIYSQFLEKPENIVSVEIFRKYISYAKKLKPKLEIDNIDLLKEFYHETRKKSLSKESNMTGMPIGARHLQGVIRLAEAAAKIRLSDTVDIEDIDLAKKLFYESLVKIGLDTSSGLIDMARMGEGKTVSKRKLYDIAIELINKISISSGNEIKDVELRQLLLDNGLSERECGDTIYSLNREGKIIKNNNVWKIL